MRRFSITMAGGLAIAFGLMNVATHSAIAGHPHMIFDTSQSPFDPGGTDNQGWWAYGARTGVWNENYVVGKQDDGAEIFRNYFTFDLTSLSGDVIEARLDLTSYYSYSPDPTETLGLFEVTTDPAVLNGPPFKSHRTFEDLGEGPSYGSFEVSTTHPHDVVWSFPLNAAAIDAINEAAGSFFSIGGALLSLRPDEELELLFAYSGGDGTQQLVVSLSS